MTCGCVNPPPRHQKQLETQNENQTVYLNSQNPKKEVKVDRKVILLGDSGVGKSSIVKRYCNNVFNDSHDVTIGAAYFQQNICLQSGQQLKMHIWDTGGSERFRTMVSLYYRDASAAIVCYDVTDEASFESVSYWINEMQKFVNSDKFVIIITANKIDAVKHERAITKERAQLFAQQNGCEHWDTSALTGQGVNEMFGYLAEQIV